MGRRTIDDTIYIVKFKIRDKIGNVIGDLLEMAQS